MGLQAWKTYQDLCKAGGHCRRMGFKCNPGDLNRFAARVRLAHSFEGVRLRDYTDGTEEGYGALIRAALSYSALESLRRALGYTGDHDFAPDLATLDQTSVLERFRGYDPGDGFSLFVREHVSSKNLRLRLETLYREGPSATDVGGNIVHLGAGLRHLFFHGDLTPSARQVSPSRAASACDVLSESLMALADSAFAQRIETYRLACGYVETPTVQDEAPSGAAGPT